MADLTQYRCKLCGATLAAGTVKGHYTKLHPTTTEIKAVQISAAKTTKIDPIRDVDTTIYWIAL